MGIQLGHLAAFLYLLIQVVASWNANSILGDDSRQTRALIGFVASDKADQWDEAARIYKSFAADSKWKPVSSQAMAIIEIRRGNYSKAWKLLESQSAKLDSASTSMRFGHDRLYLWLLLEASLHNQAESQFKRLVTVAVNDELTDFERRELCYFLGGIIGMLKSTADEKRIPVTTLEKGRIALESLDSRIAVEQFKVGLQTAEHWAAELQSRSQTFSTVGSDKSLSQLDSLCKELEDAVARLQETEDGMREANNVKDACKDEERKVRAQLVLVTQELKKETPGKPRRPIDPSRSRPSRPSTKYITDPITKKRVPDDEANLAADREYRAELANYELALRNFRDASRTYEEQLAQWKRFDAARRAQLESQKLFVAQTLAAKEAEVKTTRAEAMQKVELVRESTEAEKQLRQSLAIARVAHQHVNAVDSSSKSLFRPSNFRLLNYSSEVTRLVKCLREVPP